MRRTKSQSLVFLPLLFIFMLVTSCSLPAEATDQTHATATAQGQATVTTALACPSALHLSDYCISPLALRTAYGIEPLRAKGYTGKGQTIIDIVSFGSPTLTQDMETFDKTFNLPAANIQVISPLKEAEKDPQHDKEGWAAETTLDVQIIHALAPEAKIVVLESPVAETEGTIGLPEFRQLEQYVIDHHLGNIVSHSWGASELTLTDKNGQAELKRWDTLLKTGTLQDHITYVSSSGDNGATDYSDLAGTKLATVRTTGFVASSPWSTTVGGTNLRYVNGQWQESAWDGSGGGFSRFYALPDYQKTLSATIQKEAQNHRAVPDVAALADPLTGFPTYVNGDWTLIGGTSASAPQWAAIVAIADQMAGRPLGFINPALYQIANSSSYNQAFRDITTGNNTNTSAQVQGYSAGTAWDPVTGLGTPNVQYLIPDLIANSKS